jgi:transposase
MVRGLMSDREWDFFRPFVSRHGTGRRPRNHRLILDGIFWIARTGVQWRDLPDYFGKWSSVYRQFRRWTLSGLWDLLLEILNDATGVRGSVQMVDSTIVRAHHCAAGAKGGLIRKLLVDHAAALRQKSTLERTVRDALLALS